MSFTCRPRRLRTSAPSSARKAEVEKGENHALDPASPRATESRHQYWRPSLLLASPKRPGARRLRYRATDLWRAHVWLRERATLRGHSLTLAQAMVVSCGLRLAGCLGRPSLAPRGDENGLQLSENSFQSDPEIRDPRFDLPVLAVGGLASALLSVAGATGLSLSITQQHRAKRWPHGGDSRRGVQHPLRCCARTACRKWLNGLLLAARLADGDWNIRWFLRIRRRAHSSSPAHRAERCQHWRVIQLGARDGRSARASRCHRIDDRRGPRSEPQNDLRQATTTASTTPSQDLGGRSALASTRACDYCHAYRCEMLGGVPSPI
jgi:hypothetical protein